MAVEFKYAFVYYDVNRMVFYEVEYMDEDPTDMDKRFKWQIYQPYTGIHTFLKFKSMDKTTGTRYFQDGSKIKVQSEFSAIFTDSTRSANNYKCSKCSEAARKELPT